ncbi:12214_t:CDS:2 [Funneliformis geosporum]|nr:12214_t:CDS:2 [Funneliformis geosporum]
MIILDEANAIIRQISSNTNARKSENAICNILRSVRHVLVINPFANTSTLTFLQTYRGENIHTVDNKYQPRIGDTVEFVYDLNSRAEAIALVKKASKLTKSDNSHIRAPYTNTMEAEISFKVTSYFDIVIAITNITTPVYVKTLTQMLYQIHDSDTMALKRFYLQNFYDGKDINIDDWNNLCNRKIVKYFSPLEPQKYFLYLSQFQRHGYDEESEIEGLKAENTT